LSITPKFASHKAKHAFDKAKNAANKTYKAIETGAVAANKKGLLIV